MVRRYLFKAGLISAVSALMPSLKLSGIDSLLPQGLPRHAAPYWVQISYVSTNLNPFIDIESLQNKSLIESINSKYIDEGLLQFEPKSDGFRFRYQFLNTDIYLAWEQEMVLSKAINRQRCHKITTIEETYVCPESALVFNKQIFIHFT